jgi:RNA polymerase sigma-70 factor (ECF subfamily)
LAIGNDFAKPGRVIVVTVAESSEPIDPYVHLAVAFEAFYAAEYPSVVRLAAALCGRRDLAEEVAQDAFLAAHQRWSSVGAYEQPGAWVRRVALNRSLSSLRRRATEARLVMRLRGDRARTIELSEPEIEVWKAVRALPPRQAQVLALTFLEDRSVAEIANILGCDENTVRTHLRRGRMTLSNHLGQAVRDDG